MPHVVRKGAFTPHPEIAAHWTWCHGQWKEFQTLDLILCGSFEPYRMLESDEPQVVQGMSLWNQVPMCVKKKTRRRMARERRGAESSVASMETLNCKTIY